MLRLKRPCCSALTLPVADSATVLLCMRSYDEHAHERFPTGDPSKRAFTYFVLTGGRFIYASALRLAVLKFILSMTASFLCQRSDYRRWKALISVADCTPHCTPTRMQH
jgi:Ubiquinol cytochrome reductase transmembrane region